MIDSIIPIYYNNYDTLGYQNVRLRISVVLVALVKYLSLACLYGDNK